MAGGEGLITPIFPNSPCGSRGQEGGNIIASNSRNEKKLNNDINFEDGKVDTTRWASFISSEINSGDPSLILNNLRIIIGHLNISHIDKEFEPLISLVKDKLDIILFSETKIDSSFPPPMFVIYSSGRL